MGTASLFGRARHWLLDASVVRSFERSGYLRHSERFEPSDLDVDLSDRICAVTGANSGIGYATARALAQRGAAVWLLCRSAERGQTALERLREETGSARLHLELVDMSSLGSIRALAERFPPSSLHVLVHNAGVLPPTREQTDDGLEVTLATNLVGPFLLTHLLLERLERGAPARIIHVSTGGMYPRRLSCDALARREGSFDGVRVYADTKRAMVVLSEQLASRLSDRGIASHCMHPGWADTPAVKAALPTFHRLTKGMLRTPEQGADTAIWLAVTPRSLQSGAFWFDRAEQPTHVFPWTQESTEERERLWTLLEHWSGLDQAA